MPKKNQKTVTLPRVVYNVAEESPKRMKLDGVKVSVAGYVSSLIMLDNPEAGNRAMDEYAKQLTEEKIARIKKRADANSKRAMDTFRGATLNR